ncbi:ABC transporter C family member 3-like [Oppia nitens]|uniref:ABC transporter C family member 3-like n=1 Tax=Oppia nitens TaxID=1686743 RepID=UPI0023DA0983|nr:ABC transporter C family member 3-like [Oppia nitens]
MNKFFDLKEINPYVCREDSRLIVSIDNGDFSWDKTTDNTSFSLKHINLKISDGMFVAIIGNVGSGKSSLLSALLGEMEIMSGNVNIRKGARIAYVSQQAWIQNMTLKNNILFGKKFKPKLYEKVLHDCALIKDLQLFPGGDETEIGENGVNLSGGQKQRVNLARAVYSGSDIYIMDDPLSAVDSHVGQHIMTNIFDSKSGILRNKTRILVTNQLFVLPNVDLIVILKDGKISSMGAYNQLLNNDNDFAELIKQYTTVDTINNEENDNNILLIIMKFLALNTIRQFGLRASKQLHKTLLSTILSAPMSFFDTQPIGRILNRFSRDFDVMDFFLILSIRYN